MAGSEDGYVAAFIQMQRFADCELLVFGDKDGLTGAAEAKVNRAVVLGDSLHGSFGLVVITGVDDRHAGEHPHHADIFEDLVRSTVFAQRQAGMAGTYLHVFIAVGDALPNLVVDAARGEVSKGGRHRNFSGGSQTGGNAHHVGFGNTTLYETVGVSIDKVFGLHGTAQVGGEHNDVIVLIAGGFEAGTEAVTGGFFAGLL